MKEEGSFNHILIVIGCCSAGALRRIFILCHRNRLSLVCLSDVRGGMKRRCWRWRWVEMWLAEGALIHSTSGCVQGHCVKGSA